MNNMKMKRNEDFRTYYDIKNEYKKGRLSKIYIATQKGKNEKVAIKIIDKKRIKEMIKKRKIINPSNDYIKPYIDGFLKKVDYMKKIEDLNKDNINTVKLYETFETEKEFVFVMELCDDNLLDLFIRYKNPFNEEEIYDILSQLNYTFRIMNENNIYHSDLRPENILVKYKNIAKTKYTLKLADYGLNKDLINLIKIMDIGACNYMAPELLKNNQVDNPTCDLWSLGVIIYLLCFKEYPYNFKNPPNINDTTLDLIIPNQQKNFKTTQNTNLNKLINGLLRKEKVKILTWKNYFTHQFFIDRDYKNYYDDIKEISKGEYSTVYTAKHKKNNQKRAIKVINKDNLKKIISKSKGEDMKSYIDWLYNQIDDYMKKVKEPNKDNRNTVKYYEYFENQKEYAIVMELCDENLANLLEKKGPFSAGEIYDILTQLNNTFRIMANNQFTHRDLKLENILVKYENEEKTEYTLKITDYRVSEKLILESKKLNKKQDNTCVYMAPEILLSKKDEKYDLYCDLWSIGVIIYVLFFKELPIVKNDNVNIKSTGNKNLDDLIKNLLIKDPNNRLKWDDYFNHPFFKKKPESNITLIVKVNEKDKKDDEFNNIYFLDNDFKMKNSLEKKNYKENEEINNLIKSNGIELYINDKKQDKINKFFKPEQEGEYTIKIIFNKKIKDCSYMFSWCENITSIDLSSFDSSSVTKMKYMFGRCHYLEEIKLNNLNTQNVTDMSYMFNKCFYLKEIDLPTSFKTNNVNNMSFMFHFCRKLEKINFLPSFQTNNVTNMKTMFGKCFLLKELDLQNFNTENVENMSYMFDQCCNLEKILIDPSKFKTNRISNMSYMFNKCKKLVNIELSSFTAKNIDYLNSMFCECENLEEIDLSNFANDGNMNKTVNMTCMFKDCYNLKNINLSSFKVTDKDEMINLFDNSEKINKITVSKDCIDIFKKKYDSLESVFKPN